MLKYKQGRKPRKRPRKYRTREYAGSKTLRNRKIGGYQSRQLPMI